MTRGTTLLHFVWFTASVCILGSGFLQTKIVLPGHTTRTMPQDNLSRETVDHVVVVLVDALRPDFVFPELDSRMSREHYLTFIADELKSSPDTVGFAFVADAPTATSPRLKALMTGSLPTFLEAANNFDSDEVKDDNFISQLSRNNKTCGIIGDDTWLGLFPARLWTHYHVFPSFDAFDLHTVDDGILDSIEQTLSLRLDVTVVHFLGVDHAGHRYGANTLPMSAKLHQTDLVLRRISQYISSQWSQDTTVLMVLGDHGMTDGGDHGGGSDSETTSFFFAKYYPSAADNATGAASGLVEEWTQLRKSLGVRFLPVGSKSQSSLPYVSQMDLVSTLCTLVGVPVPKGNLGGLMTEVVVIARLLTSFDKIRQAVQFQATQVFEYLNEYAAAASLTEHPSVLSMTRNFETAVDTKVDTTAALELMIFLGDAATFARKQWTQFNVNHMTTGVVLAFALALHLLWKSRTTLPVLVALVAVFVQLLTTLQLDEVCLAASFSLLLFVARDMRLALPMTLFACRLVFPLSNSFIVRDDLVCHNALIALSLMLPRVADSVSSVLKIVVALRIAWLGVIQREHSTHLIEGSAGVSMTVQDAVCLVGLVALAWRMLSGHRCHRVQRIISVLLGVTVMVQWIYREDLTAPVCVFVSRVSFALLLVFWGSTFFFVADYGMRLKSLLCSLTFTALVFSSPRVAVGYMAHMYIVIQLDKCRMFRDKDLGVIIFLLSHHLFYSTGHQTEFTLIDWSAAFVGTGGFNWCAGAVFVPLSTLAPVVFYAIAAVLLSDRGGDAVRWHRAGFLFDAVGGMVSVYVHLRHLMLWAIFCPTMCYQVAKAGVVLFCGIIF